MLFFWEGLLALMFGMILAGGRQSYKTAVKAIVLVGVSDLCMMLGIGMTGFLAGTFTMDKIGALPMDAAGIFAFVLMMIGAIAKAGSMPFHSWIPDASKDAPLPFMVLMPAVLEKLLGIYLLARICIDLFKLTPGSAMSTVMMTIGAITILFAVMMALIQKDYKKLLSYHAISQVGYMILGIGTALPIGIIGGLFHMINHAMYKGGLFLTAGSVERQTGTTDLGKLGGLGRKMPVTFLCFLITAAAISGVPPMNGFFSKELVFEGALESGWIFYVVAVLGAFLTAASFLKLGHTAFLGKSSDETANVKEAPVAMLVPMLLIAGGCVLFGVWNALPLKGLIEPILGNRIEGAGFSGLPQNLTIFAVSIGVLVLAFLNHLYGVRRTGKALGSVDHIHYAPGLSIIYNLAERGVFDPYVIGMKLVNGFSIACMGIDRAIDFVYEKTIPKIVFALGSLVKKPYKGNNKYNIAWSLGGAVIVIMIVILMTR
jgi:NADH-quinone oxidoreductase subunit L